MALVVRRIVRPLRERGACGAAVAAAWTLLPVPELFPPGAVPRAGAGAGKLSSAVVRASGPSCRQQPGVV